MKRPIHTLSMPLNIQAILTDSGKEAISDITDGPQWHLHLTNIPGIDHDDAKTIKSAVVAHLFSIL